MDYTIIVFRRELFGEGNIDIEGAPPKMERNYTFHCPNVDSSETSVIMMRLNQVDFKHNEFTINNTKIDAGLPQVPDHWGSQVLLLKAGVLKAKDNILHVKSVRDIPRDWGEADDFAIDNVVLFYKTKK